MSTGVGAGSFSQGNYHILSVSGPVKSNMPPLWRKVSGRHDGLYVAIEFLKGGAGASTASAHSELRRTLRVRVISSGKDANTAKMQEAYKKAIILKTPITEGGSHSVTYDLSPSSLKKHLFKTDLLNSEQKAYFDDALRIHGNDLLKALNSLSSEGASAPSATAPLVGSSAQAHLPIDEEEKVIDDYMQYGANPGSVIPLDQYITNLGVTFTLNTDPLREGTFISLGEGTFGSVLQGTFEGKNVAIKMMKRGEKIDQELLTGEGITLCLSETKTEDHFVKHHFIVVETRSSESGRIERKVIKTRGEFFRLPPNSLIIATVSDLAGVSIKNIMGNKPTPEMIVNIGRQAARALAALHKQGVVHHDFKPDNCLIDENGKVRLIDAGLSYYLGKQGKVTSDAGSRFYFAPEICQREEHDHKVDSWALGVTLLQLLVNYQGQGMCNMITEYQDNLRDCRVHYDKNIENFQDRIKTREAEYQALLKNKNPNKAQKLEIEGKKEGIKNLKQQLDQIIKIAKSINNALTKPELFVSEMLNTRVHKHINHFLNGLKPIFQDCPYRKEIVAVLGGLLTPNPKLRLSAQEAADKFAIIEKKLSKSSANACFSGGGGGGGGGGGE